MAGGKSFSQKNKYGVRAKNKEGRELAPKSLRKNKKFLDQCTEDELKKCNCLEK